MENLNIFEAIDDTFTLQVGDKIKRFEVRMTKEIEHVYEIESVTKTLAKSGESKFKRKITTYTTMPDDRFLGEVQCIDGSDYHRYFVLKR